MIVIVDENDNVIGSKGRNELATGDIYRVTGLWITNSRGQVLMAQRAFTKKKDPGVWGPAVAGTVEDGESYDDNMLKEVAEEIGLSLSIDQLRRGPRMCMPREGNRFWNQWYYYKTDASISEFTIQEAEVAALRWFESDELIRAIAETPEQFTRNAPNWIDAVMSGANS